MKQFLSRGGTSHAAVGCAVATLIWEHLAVTRLRVPGVSEERGSCMPLWAAWSIVGRRPDSIIGTRPATECLVAREKWGRLVRIECSCDVGMERVDVSVYCSCRRLSRLAVIQRKKL